MTENDLFSSLQWCAPESKGPITHAMYSCDSQSIYVSLEDGSVSILTASNLRMRCRINPNAYLPPNPRYIQLNFYQAWHLTLGSWYESTLRTKFDLIREQKWIREMLI